MIFHARVLLQHQDYPDTRWTTLEDEIVMAESEDEAEAKIIAAMTKDDAYGHNICVASIKLKRAIV
jgi:hypothetical protein